MSQNRLGGIYLSQLLQDYVLNANIVEISPRSLDDLVDDHLVDLAYRLVGHFDGSMSAALIEMGDMGDGDDRACSTLRRARRLRNWPRLMNSCLSFSCLPVCSRGRLSRLSRHRNLRADAANPGLGMVAVATG